LKAQKGKALAILELLVVSTLTLFMGQQVTIAQGTGSGLSASNTSESTYATAPPQKLPSGIVRYVPIAFTNGGGYPTGSRFDQMVTVNSSTFSGYEAANLQNVEFFYGNGSIIPSWLESGNSAGSSNTVYWLKLVGGIAAGRILYAYLGFASTGTNLFNGQAVGEAPELSHVYGQYDNGKNVFQFYDNFSAGSSNKKWAVSLGPYGSFNRVDGLQVSVGGAFGYFVTKSTFGAGTAFDAYVTTFGDTNTVGYFNRSQVAQPVHGVDYSGAFIRSACINIYPDQYNSSGDANPCGNTEGSLYGGTASVAGVYTVDVVSPTSSVQSINYSHGSTNQPIDDYYPTYPASVGFMGPGGNSFGVQWVRVRNAASGDLMPTVTVGNSSGPPLAENTLWASPDKLNFNQFNGSMGAEFNLTIWAHVQSGSYSWKVKLTFDPSFIAAVSTGFTGAKGSQFYSGYKTKSPPPVLNNTAGSVLAYESLTSGENSTERGGSLFWVEFKIVSTPTMNESLSGAISMNNKVTHFKDSAGNVIATSKLDFNYSFAPASVIPNNTPVEYTNSNYPVSIDQQYYTSLVSSRTFTASVPSGRLAISVGVMNGTVAFEVTQGGTTLISESVDGPPFDYTVVTGSSSYRYVNFNSTGTPLSIVAVKIAGMPDLAFNVYSNYISKFTASLITYPPQFGAPIWASPTPVNTGMTVLLVAPRYPLPTPLSIQGNLGYCGTDGKEWYTQIGFNDWANNFNVSYAGWGISSNFFGNYGSTDLNLPLIPGDTYNFTMALVSGTTWEWVLNGTLINEGGNLTGLFDAHTTYANCGANFGMEGLPWYGGSVNITSMIRAPMMLSFRVNGHWTEPKSMAFTGIGENWNNGKTSWAPGISLWGIAGHLQNLSVPKDSLLFNDSLPMMFSVAGPNEEPVYGKFGFPLTDSGGGLVSINRISATMISVSPLKGPTIVSLISYGTSLQKLTSARSELISASSRFNLPKGTTEVVVYAENILLTLTSSTVINMTAPQSINTASPNHSSVAKRGLIGFTASETLGGSSSTMDVPIARAAVLNEASCASYSDKRAFGKPPALFVPQDGWIWR
jgi:hypothetical protein